VVSFLTLASGGDRPDFEAFLMPFDSGILICVAPGLRPAPARRPPDLPLAPAISRHESDPTDPTKSKKVGVAGLLCTKQMTVPCEAHLKMDHNGTFELEFR
jgi:hypothetical protein